jgi:hypothetical protein
MLAYKSIGSADKAAAPRPQRRRKYSQLYTSLRRGGVPAERVACGHCEPKLPAIAWRSFFRASGNEIYTI